MKSEKKRTPTKAALAAWLKSALGRLASVSPCAIAAAGLGTKKPKRRKPYTGHFLPEEFPEVLRDPVTKALDDRDGIAVLLLLLGDEADYYPRRWNLHNQGPTAEYTPQMWVGPLVTLARMVYSGEIKTVSELQVRIEQVQAMTGRKYRTLSRKKETPKIGHGRPKQRGGESKSAPNLFVCLANRVEKEAFGARPDELACESEVKEIVDRVRQTLDPLDLLVFDEVQDYRVRRGVSGAYPFAARRLVAIEQGLPWSLTDPTIDAGPTPSRATVARVRRTFLRVRAAFERAVTQAGYDVPEARRHSGKRKAIAGRLAAERNPAG